MYGLGDRTYGRELCIAEPVAVDIMTTAFVTRELADLSRRYYQNQREEGDCEMEGCCCAVLVLVLVATRAAISN